MHFQSGLFFAFLFISGFPSPSSMETAKAKIKTGRRPSAAE